MARERQIKIVFAGDARGLERAMGLVDKRAGSLDQKLIRTGSTLTRRLTLPIVAMGGAAVKAFSDFDDAMTKSTAIMGDLSESMRTDLEEGAREVAKTTTFSAREAADAYFFLASAGLDAAASLEAMPKVANFAQAGMFDMARATDLLTDAQSALGLASDDAQQNLTNMERVSDVFVKANTLANTSVEQIADAMTNKAGAAARTLSKDVEETSAVLAAFADQGTKGAAAGNALNIVWRDLTTRARDNAGAFEEFNISVFDSEGAMRNTADIVGDLERALEGMSTEQQRATLAQLGFQDRSVAFITTLLGTSDAIRGYERDLRDAAGITQEIADKQLESFAAQLKIAKDRVTDAAISIGGSLAPSVKGLAEVVVLAVEAFSKLPDPIKASAGALVILAAAAGPVMVIGGRLVRTWRAVATTLAAVQGQAALAGTSITTLRAASIAAAGAASSLATALAKIAPWLAVINGVMQIWHEVTKDAAGDLGILRGEVTELNKALSGGALNVGEAADELANLKIRVDELREGSERKLGSVFTWFRRGMSEEAQKELARLESQIRQFESAIFSVHKEINRFAPSDRSLITLGSAMAASAAEGIEAQHEFLEQQKETAEQIEVFAGMTREQYRDWRQGTVSNFNLVKDSLGELAQENELTAGTIIESLKTALGEQIEFGDNWSTVTDRAGGAATGFLQHIQETYGAKAPGIVKALADANDDEFRKMIRMWNRAERNARSNSTKLGRALGNIEDQTGAVGDEADTAAGKVDNLYESLRKLGSLADMKFSLSVDVPSGDGLGILGTAPAGTPTAMAQEAIAQFGGSLGSGYRPGAITASGNPSLHGIPPPNNARDFGGSGSQMLSAARFLATKYGSQLRELIHTPLQFGIKNGRRVPLSFFGDTVNRMHYDHVHVADRGGRFRGPGVVGIGNIDEFVFQPARKVSNDTPQGQVTVNITVNAPLKDRKWIEDATERATYKAMEALRKRDSRIERAQLLGVG